MLKQLSVSQIEGLVGCVYIEAQKLPIFGAAFDGLDVCISIMDVISKRNWAETWRWSRGVHT